jgi:hypothetical protein
MGRQITKLGDDIEHIIGLARKEDYMFGARDAFAIGYMAGKYNLTALVNNEKEVMEACDKYDEMDECKLLDTIRETLFDLKLIPSIE